MRFARAQRHPKQENAPFAYKATFLGARSFVAAAAVWLPPRNGRGAGTRHNTRFISSEIGSRKPARAFGAHRAEALDLPSDAVPCFSDGFTNNYAGAWQAGMRAILFDAHGRGFARRTSAKLGDLRLHRL
jgi:hypothetical protein